MSIADNYKIRPSAPGSVLPEAPQPPSLARHYSTSLPPQAAAAELPSSLWCPRHALVGAFGTPEVLAVFPVITSPSLKVQLQLQRCWRQAFDPLQKDSRNKKTKQEEETRRRVSQLKTPTWSIRCCWYIRNKGGNRNRNLLMVLGLLL